MSESVAPSLLDVLASLFDEYKYGVGKNYSIIRSSSAVVSIAASALLVWILFRSRNGMQTTYHRLLLGLSVSDILFSLSQATFGAVVPSEMSYAVWNARGNRATCDAFGFLHALGGFSALVYMCSLNLYYLAKVKYNKTDCYIVMKLEPWLHVVPILFGLTNGVVNLATQSINEARLGGVCLSGSVYDPPHCDGYEDGDAPEGFEIPCGRGRSAEPIFYVTGIVTGLVAPVAIGGSLWKIYRTVLRDERRRARYGAGALQINCAEPTTNDAAATNAEGGGQRRGGSTLHPACRPFPRRASDSFQSRAVLHRATAYSVAYFVTWIWYIIAAFLILGGVWTTELPEPKWQINYRYVLWFFSPLQGLWTFLIYIHPDVIKRKTSSEGDASWFGAFADALWSAVGGGDNSAGRVRNLACPGAHGAAAAPGRRGTGNTAASIGSADRQGTCACDLGGCATNPLPAPGAEGTGAAFRVAGGDGLVRPADGEEKREIEPHEENEEETCETEPCEEEEGGYASRRRGRGESEGATTRGAVVGDGFESFYEYLFGPSDPRGAGAVVGVGFESFLAFLRGQTDPQVGLDSEEPVGLEAERAEDETTEIEECRPRESCLSSYYSARETGTSYFSTRDSLSSYYSARGTESDDPNDE